MDEHDDTGPLLEGYLGGRSDYHIVRVSTIAEGLRLARRQRFDLYLVDDTLPDGSGVEMCRQIRLFDKETPIVFFSGLMRETERLRGRAAGAQAYLAKTGGLDDLRDLVERLLHGTERPEHGRGT